MVILANWQQTFPYTQYVNNGKNNNKTYAYTKYIFKSNGEDS